jgi:hypothetical protein
LWPLAADWKRITGLSPKAAIAKAVRSGRARRTVAPITSVVAMLATIASTRNASTSVSRRDDRRVTRPARWENSGPYTDGVSNHFGPTRTRVRKLGKSAGVATYGFSPWSDTIWPCAM